VIEVTGPSGIIAARVICDSISEDDIRITTYEIEVPRIVWAEFMTHCMFSRNAASSRAIPFDKMQAQLKGRPVRFGEANKGMQDKGEDHDALVSGRPFYGSGFLAEEEMIPMYWAEEAWEEAKKDAIFWSKAFQEAGFHKQVYNRLTEPFQVIKAVVTATEFNNFFWLRDDGAADPTIAELARCMKQAREQSKPQLLKAGDWHLPYVSFEYVRLMDGSVAPTYWIEDKECSRAFLDVEEAIQVSAARCAAVSFRNVDYGLEKCREVYDRLIGDERKHASALEHQASPMEPCKYWDDAHNVYHYGPDINVPSRPETWQPGVTHMDRKGQLWSAKFRGWIMNRKLIDGENKEG